MNTTQAILTRRSIRKYKKTLLPDDAIQKILKAGMYAPSAMNLQPWEFVVMNESETIELCCKSASHGESIIKQSSAAILVCGDNKVESNLDYIVQNCSAAVQNMLLEVHEMGLGACWIGVYPLKDVMNRFKEDFHLPEYIIPIALISIGHPDEIITPEERFKKEKIHYNKW